MRKNKMRISVRIVLFVILFFALTSFGNAVDYRSVQVSDLTHIYKTDNSDETNPNLVPELCNSLFIPVNCCQIGGGTISSSDCVINSDRDNKKKNSINACVWVYKSKGYFCDWDYKKSSGSGWCGPFSDNAYLMFNAVLSGITLNLKSEKIENNNEVISQGKCGSGKVYGRDNYYDSDVIIKGTCYSADLDLNKKKNFNDASQNSKISDRCIPGFPSYVQECMIQPTGSKGLSESGQKYADLLTYRTVKCPEGMLCSDGACTPASISDSPILFKEELPVNCDTDSPQGKFCPPTPQTYISFSFFFTTKKDSDFDLNKFDKDSFKVEPYNSNDFAIEFPRILSNNIFFPYSSLWKGVCDAAKDTPEQTQDSCKDIHTTQECYVNGLSKQDGVFSGQKGEELSCPDSFYCDDGRCQLGIPKPLEIHLVLKKDEGYIILNDVPTPFTQSKRYSSFEGERYENNVTITSELFKNANELLLKNIPQDPTKSAQDSPAYFCVTYGTDQSLNNEDQNYLCKDSSIPVCESNDIILNFNKEVSLTFTFPNKIDSFNQKYTCKYNLDTSKLKINANADSQLCRQYFSDTSDSTKDPWFGEKDSYTDEEMKKVPEGQYCCDNQDDVLTFAILKDPQKNPTGKCCLFGRVLKDQEMQTIDGANPFLISSSEGWLNTVYCSNGLLQYLGPFTPQNVLKQDLSDLNKMGIWKTNELFNYDISTKGFNAKSADKGDISACEKEGGKLIGQKCCGDDFAETFIGSDSSAACWNSLVIPSGKTVDAIQKNDFFQKGITVYKDETHKPIYFSVTQDGENNKGHETEIFLKPFANYTLTFSAKLTNGAKPKINITNGKFLDSNNRSIIFQGNIELKKYTFTFQAQFPDKEDYTTPDGKLTYPVFFHTEKPIYNTFIKFYNDNTVGEIDIENVQIVETQTNRLLSANGEFHSCGKTPFENKKITDDNGVETKDLVLSSSNQEKVCGQVKSSDKTFTCTTHYGWSTSSLVGPALKDLSAVGYAQNDFKTPQNLVLNPAADSYSYGGVINSWKLSINEKNKRVVGSQDIPVKSSKGYILNFSIKPDSDLHNTFVGIIEYDAKGKVIDRSKEKDSPFVGNCPTNIFTSTQNIYDAQQVFGTVPAFICKPDPNKQQDQYPFLFVTSPQTVKVTLFFGLGNSGKSLFTNFYFSPIEVYIDPFGGQTYFSDCCQKEYCWSGNSCVQASKTGLTEFSLGTKEQYSCKLNENKEGTWIKVVPKKDWNEKDTGYCSLSECILPNKNSYLDLSGKSYSAASCVPSGFMNLEGHYCDSGSWTTRLSKTAVDLLSYVQNENQDTYTLHCGNYLDVLNNVGAFEDEVTNYVDNHPSAKLSTFEKKIKPVLDRQCAGENDCIFSVCVLQTGQTEKQTFLAAPLIKKVDFSDNDKLKSTSLDLDSFEYSFLTALGEPNKQSEDATFSLLGGLKFINKDNDKVKGTISSTKGNFMYCDDAIANNNKDGNFHQCGTASGNAFVWYNAPEQTLLFSKKAFAFSSVIIPAETGTDQFSILDIFKHPIQFIVSLFTQKVTETIQKDVSENSIETTQLIHTLRGADQIFVSEAGTNGGSILGFLKRNSISDSGSFLIVYKNVNLNLCALKIDGERCVVFKKDKGDSIQMILHNGFTGYNDVKELFEKITVNTRLQKQKSCSSNPSDCSQGMTCSNNLCVSEESSEEEVSNFFTLMKQTFS